MKKLITLLILISSFAKAQDTSAIAYFNRAGITDSLEMYAVNVFVDTLKSENIWNNAILINLCSPTCYGASINNLINSNYALYSGCAPKYSTTGFLFNGVNQYLKTGLNPSITITSNNFTIFERIKSGATGGIDLGCSVSGDATKTNYIYVVPNQARLASYTTTTLLNGSTTSLVGNFFFDCYSSTSRAIRKNKTSLVTSSATISGTQPNLEYYLGCMNTSNTNTTMANSEITSFGIFSPSLSIAKQNILSDALDKYNSTVISGGR